MKTIMLRRLDEKTDIVDIVGAYMERPRVNTKSASTAIESLIRQFDRDQRYHREITDGAGRKILLLERELAALRHQQQAMRRKLDALREAFGDLMRNGDHASNPADVEVRSALARASNR